MRCAPWTLALLTITTAAPLAMAGMQPMTFTGLVQSVADDAGILSGAVAPGDAFSILALFDSLAPDTNPDPVWGSYQSIGAPDSPRLALSLPGFTLSSPAASAVVANDLPVPEPNPPMLDLFRLEAAFDTIVLGRHIAFFVQLLLIDGAALALSSDALPGSPLDPVHFPSARQLIITGAEIGGPEQFTIIASVSVPTPGALALCAIACLPLLRRPRRSGDSHR